MPKAPAPLPRDLGRVFSTTRATEAGVSAKRLRARDLEAPFSGVRAVPTPPPAPDENPLARDRAERVRVARLIEAYEPLMAEHAFVAGVSALVVQGVSVPHGTLLHIGVPEPERAPRRRGIAGRMIAPHLLEVLTYDGVRVATPASAWAMSARELPEDELVRIGDQIVRIPRDAYGRPRPERQLANIADLCAAAKAGRRVGAARLSAALTRIRVGSMSPLETDGRLVISDAGLPEPELDVEIRDSGGRLIGICDLVYRKQRVLIEVEGDHHRTDRAQWERDIVKYAGYAAAGWQLVRLTSTHIRGSHPSAPGVVREALARAGYPGV